MEKEEGEVEMMELRGKETNDWLDQYLEETFRELISELLSEIARERRMGGAKGYSCSPARELRAKLWLFVHQN